MSCKYCKNGFDEFFDTFSEEYSLKSNKKMLDIDKDSKPSIDVSLLIRQNESEDENGNWHWSDGGYIYAEVSAPNLMPGLQICSKYMNIKYCPFCGEKLITKDF